jgi:MFS superfamily sulfate permease-like transporter
LTAFDDTSTRAATYKVIINTLKGLPGTKLDAAWGLTGLVALYAIRYTCLKLERRFPHRGMSSGTMLHCAYNLTYFQRAYSSSSVCFGTPL